MSQDPAHLAALIEELEELERRLLLPGVDHDDAWALGGLLVQLGRDRGLAITVDVRRHTHQLFHAALPGTTPDNDAWVERKAAVVVRFNASSYLVGRRLAARGASPGVGDGPDPARYAAHGGSFPLRVAGTGVVGTVTVSGLPQAQDHALVVEALEAFLQQRRQRRPRCAPRQARGHGGEGRLPPGLRPHRPRPRRPDRRPGASIAGRAGVAGPGGGLGRRVAV